MVYERISHSSGSMGTSFVNNFENNQTNISTNGNCQKDRVTIDINNAGQILNFSKYF